MASLIKTVLDEGWSYSLVDAHGADTAGVPGGEWTTAKHFPTTVHVELLREGKIPDPVRPPSNARGTDTHDTPIVYRSE